MGYTSPGDVVTGTTITSTWGNLVGDATDFLANPPACRVYHNANQSLTDNTLTLVAFNSERYDTNTMHDTATNNSRITFTTAGLYLVTFNGNFAARGDYVEIYAEFIVNVAATVIAAHREQPNNTSLSQYAHLATVYKFAAGDYVQVNVRQDNAANAAANLVSAGNQSPEFSATWLGLG
jgi:hypothetical protein